MNAKPSDLVTQSTKSLQSYQEAVPHIKSMVKTNDPKVIKDVISQIKKIIKDRKCTPQQKLFCLELFNECLMLKIPNYLNYAQEKILERLSILAAKKPFELFRDSQKSQVNLHTSQEFINNLLTHIQVWASSFGRGVGGQPTYYGTIYMQLKNKVDFPQMVKRESYKSDPVRLEENKKRANEPSAKVTEKKISAKPASMQVKQVDKSDKETLEYLDNVLNIIEELENPLESDTGKELIESINGLKEKLNDILNRALNKDDSVLTDRVLKISERVQNVLQGGKVKEMRKSLFSTGPPRYEYNSIAIFEPKTESVYKPEVIKEVKEVIPKLEKIEKKPKDLKSQNFAQIEDAKHAELSGDIKSPNYSANVPETPAKQPVNIYDDILNLDFEPITSPPQRAMFNSMQPIFPSIFSPFASTASLNPFAVSPPQFESPQSNPNEEVHNLTEQLKEKDNLISQLNKQVLELKSFNEALEQTLKKTKDLLLSKEKECEEFHIVKKQEAIKEEFEDLGSLLKKNEEKKDFFEDFGGLLMRPSIKKLEVESEPPADNEAIFRFVTCEEMAVVYDSELFQVGYQVVYGGELLKFTFFISNKSGKLIQNAKLSIEAKGFQANIDNSFFPSIEINSQIFFTVQVKFTELTPIYPRLNVECLQGTDNYAVCLKIPVNVCQFSSKIDFNAEKIWQEWEDLLFAGENFVVKCKNGKNYVPKLMKLGKNIQVFSSEQIEKLGSREYLIAGLVGELVLTVVKVKRKEGEVEFDIRSNDAKLRETVLKLLVSNLSD